MRNFIYRKLEKIVNWKILGLLLILFIFCSFGFKWREGKIGKETFDGRWTHSPISGNCWYDPPQARQMLENMKPEGRRIYAITQLTLDLLFPFVYGGLIIIIFFTLYGSPKYLLLIPIGTVAADLLENLTTAYLALSYKGFESSVAWFATTFTAAKSAGLYLSGILILAGIILFIRRRWRQFI